ncbi:MAG TPA: SurA N-terminal domain-containing protein [Edaphocola sp.]|nr:SurA N-terminal domain-containing protein [Edaphocola sp.]
MAIIQSIRDKYAKLAGGVIVLALVGFILMDSTSGGRGGGLFGPSTTVAKVNGEKIDVQEYDQLLRSQEDQMRNQGRPTDENATAQLRDQVLNQMVMDKITGELQEKLGLTVSEAELKEMLNPANPDAMVRQAFTNPQTGAFDADQAATIINQYEKTKDPKQKAEWDAFKKQLSDGKEHAKLTALLNSAYYTPKFVLDDLHSDQTNMANISYVNLPYTLVPDDKVKVSDEDINKYIAAHKTNFEIKEENRTAQFVTFTINPSTEDSNRVRKELDDIKGEFETTDNIDAFVKRNSSVQMPVSFLTEQSLSQMQIANVVNEAATGAIVGPFNYGQDLAIAKVISRATLPDSVKVRHILIAMKQNGQNGPENVRTEAQAQARMDSMLALEKSGVPFDSLITKFSDDNIAQNPTGEYNLPLSQRSAYTKEFGDYAFSGAPAGSSKVVKVESPGYSGLHYIQIMSKSAKVEPTTQLAIIVKSLSPDKNTYSSVYGKASAFANKVAANPKDFEKEATVAALQVQDAPGLNQNSYMVQGLGASTDLVKWAYGAKAGEVSPIFTVGGDKIVVAKLTAINAPGLLKPTGSMKLNIESLVRNQKKAQYLIDANKSKKSLAEIAGANNVEVAQADSVNFAAQMIPNIGNEAKLLGYTFFKGFKDNTLSPGIAGMGSLYYITVNSRNKVEGPARDVKMERMMAEMQFKGRMSQMILEDLRQAADVKDTRYKVYK